MAKKHKILIVEGNDDKHVIWALLEYYKVPETLIVKVGGEKDGGIDEVLEELKGQILAGSDVETIGVVVDANSDLEKRWREIKNILNKAHYSNVPEFPQAEGTIISEDKKPRFGAWLMPDNILRGMLEDFVSYLVPENDKTWIRAKKAVDDIPQEERLSRSQHLTKAQIHTYLAWQEEPGRPMGQSITKRYLRAENPQARQFINWVRRLFDLEETSESNIPQN